MIKDSLGNRMKLYERATHFHLPPNSHVVIRVDGRAFHTFTRGCAKPFDHDLMDAMTTATIETAEDMQGFRLAYTQSDEASFLITDTDSHESQPWFDNDVSKLISITASTFTAAFNRHYPKGDGRAVFDGRGFTVPESDVPNAFLWRQRDWERNSLSMLSQAHFGHKQLHGKGRRELHDLLMLERGINWADLTPREKNGTFLNRVRQISEKLGYDEIAAAIAEVPEEEVTE